MIMHVSKAVAYSQTKTQTKQTGPIIYAYRRLKQNKSHVRFCNSGFVQFMYKPGRRFVKVPGVHSYKA